MIIVKKLIAILAVLFASLMPLIAGEAGGRQAEGDQKDLRDVERQLREAEAQLREAARRMAELQEKYGDSQRRFIERRVKWFSNRAAIGVVLRTESNESADALGATIAAVTPGGPADEAGLKAGDIVTEVNGEKLAGTYDGADSDQSAPALKLIDRAHELKEGDTVKVKYRRGKEARAAEIVARQLQPSVWAISIAPEAEDYLGALGEAPPAPPAPPAPRTPPVPPAYPAPHPVPTARSMPATPPMPPLPAITAFRLPARFMDMELVAVDADLGSYFDTNEGLLVVRPPEGGAIGLKSGDVILKIGDASPSTPVQAVRALREYKPGEKILLTVLRKGEKMTLSATAPDSSTSSGFEYRIRSRAPRSDD